MCLLPGLKFTYINSVVEYSTVNAVIGKDGKGSPGFTLESPQVVFELRRLGGFQRQHLDGETLAPPVGDESFGPRDNLGHGS